MQAPGVEFIQVGISLAEADRHLREEVLFKDTNESVSLIDEIGRQIEAVMGNTKPDTIICSVGGGGLIRIVRILDERWYKHVSVLAMEQSGGASLRVFVQLVIWFHFCSLNPLQTSMGRLKGASTTFKPAERPGVGIQVVSDWEVVNVCGRPSSEVAKCLLKDPALQS